MSEDSSIFLPMVALYATTIFVSATLLFLVQPLFARLMLPLLGGSPAVWNTAMVFYQATLLAGYAYAHTSATRLGWRRQLALQVAVVGLPLMLLPIALPPGWSPPTEGQPAFWLLGLMFVAVGAPFFAVSTTSPLLQAWFAASGHSRARDPYFLYAASNAGSLLALLAYPLILEPQLTLAAQSRLWTAGYAGFFVLIVVCVALRWKARPADAVSEPAPAAAAAGPAEAPTLRQRLRWVLLSFAPSSLMLGVTTYLSSEIAVVPLLWIVPLALYLMTFVLAFASRPLVPRLTLLRALPMVAIALAMLFNMQATQPIGGLILLHLAAFFCATLLCHSTLATARPAPAHLMEFYLAMSVGGVLGGLFNALLAPLLFRTVAEYPLTLVLACGVALAPAAATPADRVRRGDWLWALVPGMLTVALLMAAEQLRLPGSPALTGLLFGVPALVCFFMSRRPLRFALGLGGLLFAGSFYDGEKGRVLHTERSFFGVHRVTIDVTGGYHQLVHGKTLHGRQSLDPARRAEPLSYYHRTGPGGQILATYARDSRIRVGAVGLGAGSLASFAAPRQAWTYYEIDPVVEKLARDPRYFTFLRDSPGDVRVVLGDARLTLAGAPDGAFGVLVLDAFSSDAIPVHLVTREAVALYRRKLAPQGVLACHISNLHLDLEPVFGALARDAGLACLIRDDTLVSPAELALGKSPSLWLVMAREPADLAALAADPRWRPARTEARPVWTDDYSSLLSAFRWR